MKKQEELDSLLLQQVYQELNNKITNKTPRNRGYYFAQNYRQKSNCVV